MTLVVVGVFIFRVINCCQVVAYVFSVYTSFGWVVFKLCPTSETLLVYGSSLNVPVVWSETLYDLFEEVTPGRLVLLYIFIWINPFSTGAANIIMVLQELISVHTRKKLLLFTNAAARKGEPLFAFGYVTAICI